MPPAPDSHRGTPDPAILAEATASRSFFRAISSLPRVNASTEQQQLERLATLRQKALEVVFGDAAAYPHLRPHLRRLFREQTAIVRAFSQFERALPIRLPDPAEGVDPEALEALTKAISEHDPNRTVSFALEHQVLPRLRDAQLQSYRSRCTRAFERYRRQRDAFFSLNIGLVIAVAGRYQRGHLGLLDFVQEGSIGLLRAIERFDVHRGVRFSTYAVWWIRHAIGRALTDRGREIRLPAHLVERQHKLRRAKATLEASSGDAENLEQLTRLTGLSAEQVETLASLDLQRTELDDLPVRSTQAPDFDEALDQKLHLGRLEDALGDLRGLDLDVIRRRFGLEGHAPMTLREIGQMHALSRERIRQIEARALDKLRAKLA